MSNNKTAAVFWCSLAVLLYEKNRCEAAFEKIIQATKLNGQMQESWYNFGILYEKCKQAEEAVVAYNKTLEIDSTNEDAKQRLYAIKGPDYNADTFNLQMKYPNFRVSNSLIIDKNYKATTTQSPLNGILGEAQNGAPNGNINPTLPSSNLPSQPQNA